MAPARRAAWDTDLTLTTSLLPALRTARPDSTVNTKLGGVATRIMRYAPLWGETVRLLDGGDGCAAIPLGRG